MVIDALHRAAGDAGYDRRSGEGGGGGAPASVAPIVALPASGRRGLRLLMYTQDGLGLGHLRRASAIASGFLRAEPAGTVLTISDSPLGSLIRDLPNHDYMKLPSIIKAGPGDWRAHALPMQIEEVSALRSRLILEAATAFEPDVLLVDHMPHGALGELVPTLERLVGSTHIVLGVRDIIDAPEVVRERWRAEGAFDVLAAYYDRVLVYGSPEVFDLPRAYRWPAALLPMVRHCGYVCAADEPRRSGKSASRKDPRERRIVAMAGGGADAYGLMSTLLDAFPAIAERGPCSVVMVAGPFMPAAERRQLKRRAHGLPVRVRKMVSDPLKYVAAADVVVAMAGYNTTMEVLRIGTPALLVPRRGPSSEQRIRARRFAERGWVRQLDPDDLTPRSLASAVLASLSGQPAVPMAPPPDLDGSTRAAEFLREGALSGRIVVGSAHRGAAAAL